MDTYLEQFRSNVYQWFPHRADTLMDMLDALSSNTTARSVVELSLNSLFRREYSSVHDGIKNLFVPDSEESRSLERQELEQELVRLIVRYLPTPQRPFRLLGTDVTSASRPFARTLSDRTFVYRPNPVKGVKPITIGHQYSVLAVLPEKSSSAEPPWVIPLLINRVRSSETKREAGLNQITRLLADESLPFHDELCVNVLDSDYSAVTYLGGVAGQPNLVTIARLAGNRTLYRSPAPPPPGIPRSKGHPTWFGASMSLKDPTTWDAPDEVAQTTFTTRKGQV
ncbi:MAG: transposase, partial [bacterium]|nr:transposase [bacterium]